MNIFLQCENNVNIIILIELLFERDDINATKNKNKELRAYKEM